MQYLKKIGKNARKAFKDLKNVKHNKIKKVLYDYIKSLSKNKNQILKENHKDVGAIAAKYVETLQRSNEQLVKIASLMQKKSNDNANLTEDDKKELFDIIKEAS